MHSDQIGPSYNYIFMLLRYIVFIQLIFNFEVNILIRNLLLHVYLCCVPNMRLILEIPFYSVNIPFFKNIRHDY